jgi:hypothetical protein
MLASTTARGSFTYSRCRNFLAQRYVKTHGRTAADVMTRHVVSVTEDAEAGYIADLLESRRIKRVPVVRDGRVVGIVSRADLLRVLVAPPSGSAPSPDNDRALYEALMSRVSAEPWAQPLLLNIVVRDGEVQLWGVTDSRDSARPSGCWPKAFPASAPCMTSSEWCPAATEPRSARLPPWRTGCSSTASMD